MYPIRGKISVIIIFIMALCLSSCVKESNAQTYMFTKKDSIVDTQDTISIVKPGGLFEAGAFTLRNTTTTDTLKPMALYYGDTNWVTTSVKNVRTQTSDTNIILPASSWPVDFQINDPAIIGFKLVKFEDFYAANRKVYVYYRFRRQ